MTERPHVYQNRADGYKLEDMYFCGTCNGYYGVSHDDVHTEDHNWRYQYPGSVCCCRFHQDQRQLPRQGTHGWLLGAPTASVLHSDPDLHAQYDHGGIE